MDAKMPVTTVVGLHLPGGEVKEYEIPLQAVIALSTASQLKSTSMLPATGSPYKATQGTPNLIASFPHFKATPAFDGVAYYLTRVDGSPYPTTVMKPGSHAFVRAVDESYIRVGKLAFPFGEAPGHLLLSGNNSLLFAGEITLGTRGRIKEWSNKSGTYRPKAKYAGQSGLPVDLFRAYHEGEHYAKPKLMEVDGKAPLQEEEYRAVKKRLEQELEQRRAPQSGLDAPPNPLSKEDILKFMCTNKAKQQMMLAHGFTQSFALTITRLRSRSRAPLSLEPRANRQQSPNKGSLQRIPRMSESYVVNLHLDVEVQPESESTTLAATSRALNVASIQSPISLPGSMEPASVLSPLSMGSVSPTSEAPGLSSDERILSAGSRDALRRPRSFSVIQLPLITSSMDTIRDAPGSRDALRRQRSFSVSQVTPSHVIRVLSDRPKPSLPQTVKSPHAVPSRPLRTLSEDSGVLARLLGSPDMASVPSDLRTGWDVSLSSRPDVHLSRPSQFQQFQIAEAKRRQAMALHHVILPPARVPRVNAMSDRMKYALSPTKRTPSA
jgi:hypothetical protein